MAGGYFVAGVKVLMADSTGRNIETLQLGDRVMAYDIDGGEQEPCEVISRFAHRNQPVMILNDTTTCTPNALFFSKFGQNGWGFYPLSEIPIGGTLAAGDGSEIPAESIADVGRRADVFAIGVDRLQTYIANGYRVR